MNEELSYVVEHNLSLVDKPTNVFKVFEHYQYLDEDDDQTDHRGEGIKGGFKEVSSESALVHVASHILIDTHEGRLSTQRDYNKPWTMQYIDFENEKQFIDYLTETDDSDFASQFLSEKAHQKVLHTKELKKEAAHRRSMEQLVKEIMKKYHVDTFDSLETIAAIYFEEELQSEAWQDKLEGLKEDGLCIGWGVTIDQWCEERNFMRGRKEAIHATTGELIDYLEKEFPLLVAKFNQDKEKLLDVLRNQLNGEIENEDDEVAAH